MEALIKQIGLPLIAIVVPLIVALFRKIMPKIPSWLLPVIALALGPLADFIVAKLTGVSAGTGIMAALAGLAGVGVREVFNQIGKAIAEA